MGHDRWQEDVELVEVTRNSILVLERMAGGKGRSVEDRQHGRRK